MKILEITTVMRFDKYRNINYILDFTGKDYYICENGDLYWKNTKLKTEINNEGYVINGLKSNNGKKYYIFRHQLVAQYFLIDSFEEGLTVDHIDNNKTNNNVNNLRWATYKQQIKNQVRVKINNKVNNHIYNDKQKFMARIENQKEYFVKYNIPKFDKVKYSLLYRIYLIYNIMNGKYSEDIILNKYADECKKQQLNSKEEIYDYLFEKIKNYKQDNSLLLINNNEYNIDINKFELLFLNKPYTKKELKIFCKEHSIEEILKNQYTVEEFLNKLGYCLKRGKTGHVIRKIKKDDK